MPNIQPTEHKFDGRFGTFFGEIATCKCSVITFLIELKLVEINFLMRETPLSVYYKALLTSKLKLISILIKLD